MQLTTTIRTLMSFLLVTAFGGAIAWGQIGAGSPGLDSDNRYSRESVTRHWQVGAVVRAGSAPVMSVQLAIPVPTDWPEQSVRVTDREISPGVRDVHYQELEGNVKRLTARVPRLRAGATIKVLVTYEVVLRRISPPDQPDELVIPSEVDGETKRYLKTSPLINHRRRVIKQKVAELVKGHESAWDQIHSIYDWIEGQVKFVATEDVHGAVETLRDRAGNEEDRVNLFVAMCRAHGVPARIVWVNGGVYAEFFLHDAEGKGGWYPCQLNRTPEFGQLTHPRVIQQKGDKVTVPEKKKPKRWVPEFVSGKTRGNGFQRGFVRRLVPR